MTICKIDSSNSFNQKFFQLVSTFVRLLTAGLALPKRLREGAAGRFRVLKKE